MASYAFEVYEDHAGGYRWRLTSRNGLLVAASSQGFHDRAEAMENARRTYRGLEQIGAPDEIEDEDTHAIVVGEDEQT